MAKSKRLQKKLAQRKGAKKFKGVAPITQQQVDLLRGQIDKFGRDKVVETLKKNGADPRRIDKMLNKIDKENLAFENKAKQDFLKQRADIEKSYKDRGLPVPLHIKEQMDAVQKGIFGMYEKQGEALKTGGKLAKAKVIDDMAESFKNIEADVKNIRNVYVAAKLIEDIKKKEAEDEERRRQEEAKNKSIKEAITAEEYDPAIVERAKGYVELILNMTASWKEVAPDLYKTFEFLLYEASPEQIQEVNDKMKEWTGTETEANAWKEFYNDFYEIAFDDDIIDDIISQLEELISILGGM